MKENPFRIAQLPLRDPLTLVTNPTTNIYLRRANFYRPSETDNKNKSNPFIRFEIEIETDFINSSAYVDYYGNDDWSVNSSGPSAGLKLKLKEQLEELFDEQFREMRNEWCIQNNKNEYKRLINETTKASRYNATRINKS